jgi:tripartite-type tricarboxylate transporter receptor subunit TctC
MPTLARSLVRTLAAAIVLAMAGTPASAQSYPDRTIVMTIGLAAGGPTDVIGRAVAQQLSQRLGQSIVVENRPGAAGAIAADVLSKATPDGYQLLFASNSISIFPHQAGSRFNPENLVPVGNIVIAPTILLVKGDSPYKSVQDLIADARANPGKITFGSAGVGSGSHLAVELMRHALSLDMLHVPYKGIGPATQDLLGGRISLLFDAPSTALPLIRSGNVRALAVTPARRFKLLPDVPTLAESGATGVDYLIWYALFAPKGTPPAIVARLTTELGRIAADPDAIRKFDQLGVEAYYLNNEQLGNLVRSDVKKWGEQLQQMKLTLD